MVVVKGGGLGRKYAAWVSGETTLAAREFTERELREWATFVQSWRPVLLQGYASILAALARFVLDQRLAMPNTLRGVYSTAEVLTGAPVGARVAVVGAGGIGFDVCEFLTTEH